jgi:hypothetical protein
MQALTIMGEGPGSAGIDGIKTAGSESRTRRDQLQTLSSRKSRNHEKQPAPFKLCSSDAMTPV